MYFVTLCMIEILAEEVNLLSSHSALYAYFVVWTTYSLLKPAYHTIHWDKLGMHVYFCVSMTAINKKWPQALFLITTFSLLKLANHTMHGGETWYACVFLRFHDDHQQKMASGHFCIITTVGPTWCHTALKNIPFIFDTKPKSKTIYYVCFTIHFCRPTGIV